MNKPNTMFEISELICIGCHNRWVGAYTIDLVQIRCPKCRRKGLVIDTGQKFNGSVYCEICKLHQNNKCKLNLAYDEEYGCGFFEANVEEEDL